MMNEYISEMVAREDKSTAEHSGRVAKIADILGRTLRLNESELLTLDEAAKLHDVGKIKVDVKILQKPSRLTDKEFVEIKKHTVYGFAMISHENDMIAGLILSHHERWDGSGYPNGLSGFDASTRLKSWDSVAIREKYQSPYGFLRNKGFHVCSLC